MKTKRAVAIDTRISSAINSVKESLREHWIYDSVQLFSDCAIALERITQLLVQLEKRPEWIKGHETEIMKEVSEFSSFIKKWDSLAHKRLTVDLLCPDEVEFHLEELLKATSMPVPEKKKMRRCWSNKDSDLEPPIVDIARGNWDL